MRRRDLITGAAASAVVAGLPKYAKALTNGEKIALLTGVPGWVPRGNGRPADVFFDWYNDRYWKCSNSSCLSLSRASPGTSLLPYSAAGAAYKTFSSGQLRNTPGVGVLIEQVRTQLLLNSTAPVTQTTASLATGTYTLSVNGTGSALASGGTATITGVAAAINGTPNTFTVTVAGTVVVTVTGSLNAFQLELGAFATSLIVSAGATATRAAEIITITGSLLAALQAGTVTIRAVVGPLTGMTGGSQYVIGFAGSVTPMYCSSIIQIGGFNGTTNQLAVPGAGANLLQGPVSIVSSYDATGSSNVAQDGTELTNAATYAVPSAILGSANAGASSTFLSGPIVSLAIWKTRLPASARQQLSKPQRPLVAGTFWTEGDSYMSGGGSPPFLTAQLATASGRLSINTAVIGSTLDMILARMKLHPELIGLPCIIWDGQANGYSTPASYLAVLDQVIAVVGPASNIIMPCGLAVGPPNSGGSSTWLADMQTIYAGIVSRGIKTFDAQSILVANNSGADSTSTAAGLVGPAQTSDGVHLIPASMALMVPQFTALM